MKPGRFPFVLIFAVFTLIFFTPSKTQNLQMIPSGDVTAHIATMPTPEIEVTESDEIHSAYSDGNAKIMDAVRHAKDRSVTPKGPGETSLTYNGTEKTPIVIQGIVISNTVSEEESKVLPEETKL